MLTLRAADAATRRSSRAFSFCLRFLRKVSGTSISYTIQRKPIHNIRTCVTNQIRAVKTRTDRDSRNAGSPSRLNKKEKSTVRTRQTHVVEEGVIGRSWGTRQFHDCAQFRCGAGGLFVRLYRRPNIGFLNRNRNSGYHASEYEVIDCRRENIIVCLREANASGSSFREIPRLPCETLITCHCVRIKWWFMCSLNITHFQTNKWIFNVAFQVTGVSVPFIFPSSIWP